VTGSGVVKPGGRRGAQATGPKVLEKALRMLDLFTTENPSWSVTEIARELDLPIPTAHRILRMLESRSYVMKSRSRYCLGLGALELGRRAVASVDLRMRLGPVLRRLARETEETALLTVYHEARRGSLCVDRIETTHSLRLSIDIGRVTPIHAGASAKALLAFLDTPVIEDLLAHPLERLAPGTITDPERLRADLSEIRERGWALSQEENNLGAWGISAPVKFNGRVIAAIGFAGPMARHSDAAVRKLSRLVLRAARDAQALLEATGEPESDGRPA
jgi:DNA-binding IclR family transcriptional regulator